MKRYSVHGFLLGLLVIQVGLISALNSVGPKLHGPTPGTTLPPVPVQVTNESVAVSLRDFVANGSRCSLVVVAEADCPICQRLALRWQEDYPRWVDSIRTPVSAIWVFNNSEAEIARFVSAFRLASLSTAALVNYMQAQEELGVIGTPLMYLVDRDGRVVLGSAGATFPPAVAAARSCD